MLRHGWLFICLISLAMAMPLQGGIGSKSKDHRVPWHSGFRLATNPPDPGPAVPQELEEQRWKYIIDLLCVIIPCRTTDPDAETIESAAACLHVRLDRFETEGLNPDLDQATIEAWIANIDVLIAILAGPNWDVFVSDAVERDALLGPLGSLRSALEAQVSSAWEISRG